nr:ERF36 [Diospyros kaki]
MKPMSNDGNTSHGNNWLGFSLSPCLNMELPSQPHQTHPPSSVVSSANSFNFPTHYSYTGACYGGENGGFGSALTMMPLKSDGSLCMMEALNSSHPQGTVTNSTPKLEDFFGGETMGTHHYEGSDREAMALSLDSIYYQHNPDHETNSQDLLNHFQHSSRQQNHHIQVQQYSGYSAFRAPEIYQAPLEEETKETQLAENEISGMKNWVSGSYPAKMIGCMGGNGGENGSLNVLRYGDLQSLSLSMSPGSQSSCLTGSHQISPTVTECAALETKKRGSEKLEQKQIVYRKSIDTFGQRTSQYRGVTRHRWTGRYEAHLWDNSCKKEGQSRKGRQVYLGGYDKEEKAARAYDLAALKYWGPSTHINFLLENYQEELEEMKNMTRQEYVAHLRRKSSGFSRGASIYRGVTRHHQHGRWQARIGRVAGNKDLYLGTFGTQEEAAEAYDIAAIKFRGANAVTNFDTSRYDVERIMASNTILAGELARRNKEEIEFTKEVVPNENPSSTLNNNGEKNGSESDWKMTLHQSFQANNGLNNYEKPYFSVAANDLLMGTQQELRHDLAAAGKTASHLSNASSLVTSLGSSREGSPDKQQNNLALPLASEFFTATSSATDGTMTWASTSSAQLRAQLPLLHAWTTTDASSS